MVLQFQAKNDRLMNQIFNKKQRDKIRLKIIEKNFQKKILKKKNIENLWLEKKKLDVASDNFQQKNVEILKIEKKNQIERQRQIDRKKEGNACPLFWLNGTTFPLRPLILSNLCSYINQGPLH